MNAINHRCFPVRCLPVLCARVGIKGLLTGLVLAHAGHARATPTFTDVTAQAQIDHVQAGFASDDDLIARMSGGAAAGDFDGDGWMDLYVTRYHDSDILYRNNGDGTFSDATAAAFGANHLKTVRTNGVSWADINNDGNLDLYITAHQTNRHFLYMNDGNGGFTEQGIARNATLFNPTNHQGTGIAFGDINLDGYLDMYVTEWGFQPTGFQSNNRLLLNQGSNAPGHFTDITLAAGVGIDDISSGSTISYGFAPRFSDLDGDGYPDLAIASDFNTSKLFWNNGDNTFTDGTTAAGVGLGQNDMGSTIADFNGDGLMDWFTTAIVDSRGNYLYQNNGDRTFNDVTDDHGVRDGGWGWGASFLDYDNDGDQDITHTNGFTDPWLSDQTRFFVNNGHDFSEVATTLGVTDTAEGRGLLTFDFDNDGDLDIFIVNHADEPVLYRNDGGNQNNFLRIETTGTESNRQGIGAMVMVVPDLEADIDPDNGVVEGSIFQEISASSNFLAQNEVIAHFGLGDHDRVDLVSIRWPSGEVQNLFNVDANQLLNVTEGDAYLFVGDMNGDGQLDAFDVDEFEAALADPEAFELANPGVDLDALGDINGDGTFNAFDVGEFETRLARNTIPAAATTSIPEPAAVLSLGALALGLLTRRPRHSAR